MQEFVNAPFLWTLGTNGTEAYMCRPRAKSIHRVIKSCLDFSAKFIPNIFIVRACAFGGFLSYYRATRRVFELRRYRSLVFSFGEVNQSNIHMDQQSVQGNKLYVGGIPYRSTEDDLKKAFSEAGNVVSASIISDRMTGRSRGFGFVEMASEAEAQAAIDRWDGKEFDGRTLSVSFARPQGERPPRRENGFGGGFGGGNGYGRGGY